MLINDVILAKFGKLEYLELLKDGHLYFSPIKVLRDDGTLYRGDINEGKVPIDPQKFYINGKSLINDYKLPPPDSLMLSYNNDDNRFIFCSAMINNTILEYSSSENSHILCQAFKDNISQFGEHVIIFWSSELIKRLNTVLDNSIKKFGYLFNPISYVDFTDFLGYNYFIEAQKKHSNFYARYFIKDISYKIQNEWRLLINGLDCHLEANCGEGFLVDIGKFEIAQIYETSTFLDGLRWNE